MPNSVTRNPQVPANAADWSHEDHVVATNGQAAQNDGGSGVLAISLTGTSVPDGADIVGVRIRAVAGTQYRLPSARWDAGYQVPWSSLPTDEPPVEVTDGDDTTTFVQVTADGDPLLPPEE